MEYLVKDQIQRYSEQRNSLVTELIALNENLPFYDKKRAMLELQIDKIDLKIHDLVNAVERHRVFELTEKSKSK